MVAAFKDIICGTIWCAHPQPFCWGEDEEGGQGVEPPTKLSKKGLNRTSILERNCWETGGDFFRRGVPIIMHTLGKPHCGHIFMGVRMTLL